jgi:hypothetical protein
VNAKRSDDRTQYDITTKNLTRLVVREADRATAINIDRQKLTIKSAPQIVLAKSNGTWRFPAAGSFPAFIYPTPLNSQRT